MRHILLRLGRIRSNSLIVILSSHNSLPGWHWISDWTTQAVSLYLHFPPTTPCVLKVRDWEWRQKTPRVVQWSAVHVPPRHEKFQLLSGDYHCGWVPWWVRTNLSWFSISWHIEWVSVNQHRLGSPYRRSLGKVQLRIFDLSLSLETDLS